MVIDVHSAPVEGALLPLWGSVHDVDVPEWLSYVSSNLPAGHPFQ